jgi:Na+/phosphate symporter
MSNESTIQVLLGATTAIPVTQAMIVVARWRKIKARRCLVTVAGLVIFIGFVSIFTQVAYHWPGLNDSQKSQTQIVLAFCLTSIMLFSAVMQHLSGSAPAAPAPAAAVPASAPAAATAEDPEE